MNISGVLIQTQPDLTHSITNELSGLPGVEVHATTTDGRLIVTIEDDTGCMFNTMNAFRDIEGVLSTTLIYNHDDDENAPEQTPCNTQLESTGALT